MLAFLVWMALLTAALLVYPRRPRTAGVLIALMGARTYLWSEMLVSERARGVHSAAVAAFEAQRTERVEPVGVFTALDVSDRFGPTWSQRE